MVEIIELGVGLVAAVAALTLLARRLSVPVPILLVPAGVVLGFIPGLPYVHLDPEVVLSLFLPPLIFVAGVNIPWPEFLRSIRSITLLAVGCVLFTMVLVAVTAHFLLPGLPWAVAFVLGAAISPPDAVAATSIASRLGIPRRLVTVLEGEGVVNDATALTAYKFATAAAVTGVFSMKDAALTFGAIVVGEVAYGLFVGWFFSWIWTHIDDPSIEISITLLVPFVAYLPPERLGGSGVLATVVAALYIGYRGIALLGLRTRLEGRSVWATIQFLLENVLFLLTGLQLRGILGRIVSESPLQLAWYGAALSAAVILIRFVWVYPATYLPRLIPAIRKDDPFPSWRAPFLVAFAGMRGGISLAAALAIPLYTSTRGPFPRRDLIVFLTFCVIFVTLVLQGLLLRHVIHWLGLDERGHKERQQLRQKEVSARLAMLQTVLEHLEQNDDRHDPQLVAPIRDHYQQQYDRLDTAQKEHGHEGRQARLELRRHLLALERDRVRSLRDSGEINDQILQHLERQIDLAEVHLLTKLREME